MNNTITVHFHSRQSLVWFVLPIRTSVCWILITRKIRISIFGSLLDEWRARQRWSCKDNENSLRTTYRLIFSPTYHGQFHNKQDTPWNIQLRYKTTVLLSSVQNSLSFNIPIRSFSGITVSKKTKRKQGFFLIYSFIQSDTHIRSLLCQTTFHGTSWNIPFYIEKRYTHCICRQIFASLHT